MKRADLEYRLNVLWYDRPPYRLGYWLLVPLSWLFCAAVALRRAAYRLGLLRSVSLGCPVVVVGNLVAGGSGKTPLVIALAKYLHASGLRVGLLCRGYRGRSSHRPQQVGVQSDPQEVGDEAILLAQTGFPVMAGRDRVAAGRALLAHARCDVLLCDDGLQHYALRRDLEIVVVDGERKFGNGACLPAGPLRERPTRLREADRVVALEQACPEAETVLPVVDAGAYRLDDPGRRCELSAFANQAVHAVAGIAQPQRFFRRLRQAGIIVTPHAFGDHHRFVAEELNFGATQAVLMTEKDAVKCRSFSRSNWWVVPLDVRVEATFGDWLVDAVRLQEH